MRHEFVWSATLALGILFGTAVWAASSSTPVGSAPCPLEWKLLRDAQDRPECQRYEQYEFKVGYLVAPSCLAGGN